MILIVCYCFRCDSRIAAYVPQCQYICFASCQLLFFFEHHTRKHSAFVTFYFLIVLDHFYFYFTANQNISSLVREKKTKKHLKQNKKTLDNEQSWDVRNYAVLIQRSGLFSARLWSECLVYSSFTCILFLSSLEKSYGEQGKWWMLVAMLS